MIFASQKIRCCVIPAKAGIYLFSFGHRNETRIGLSKTNSNLYGSKPFSTKAFTLIEILLTIIIGSLIIVTALATYQTIADIRTTILKRSDRQADIRYALTRLRHDLANFYRSPDPKNMFIEADKDAQNARLSDRLCFLAVFDPPYTAAGDKTQTTGDLYRVEYRLVNDPQTNRPILRRITKPAQATSSSNTEQVMDVAESIRNFTCEFYYNNQWLTRWSAADGIPQMVRITLDTTLPTPDAPQNKTTQTFSLEPFPKSAAPATVSMPTTPAPVTKIE